MTRAAPERRQRLLSNASKLLASSLDIDATLDKAAWAVVPELADWCCVDLLDERGALPAGRAPAATGARRAARRVAPRLPACRGRRPGPAEVMRTGESVVWADVVPTSARSRQCAATTRS